MSGELSPARGGGGFHSRVVDEAVEIDARLTALEGGGGGASIYSVKNYGAKGDGTTDDTSAIEDAVAALPADGGVLYFPQGTYVITSNKATVEGRGPMHFVDKNVTMRGDGRDVTTLKCAQIPLEDETRMFITVKGDSRLTVEDLTLLGCDDMSSNDSGDGTSHRNLTQIYIQDGTGSQKTFLYVNRVGFRRCSYGIRYSGFNQATEFHEVWVDQCYFDNEGMGLASGEAAHPAMGILNGSSYTAFHITNTYFTGMGSDEGSAGNHSHCFYGGDQSPLTVENCTFMHHIDGRYIQSNGIAPSPGVEDQRGWRISNCYFGPHHPSSSQKNTYVHTSVLHESTYTNCHFDAGELQPGDGTGVQASKTVGVYGTANFDNCVWTGTADAYMIEVTNANFDGLEARFSNCRFLGNADDYFRISRQGIKLFFNDCDFRQTATTDTFFWTGGGGGIQTNSEIWVDGCYIETNSDIFNLDDADDVANPVPTNGLTRSGSTGTVTTASAHSIIVGDHIFIYGAGETEYNGLWRVSATPTSTTMEFEGISGTPTTPATHGINEVQNIDLKGATSGTFTLTYGASTTGTLNYNDTTATIETALDGLTGLNANQSVTGSAGDWIVTFNNALAATDVSKLVINDIDLDGGTDAPEVIVDQEGSDDIYVDGQIVHQRLDVRDSVFDTPGSVINIEARTPEIPGVLKELRFRDNEIRNGTMDLSGEIYEERSQGNIGYVPSAPLVPTLRATGAATSTTGTPPQTMNVAYPSGVQEGDLLILYVCSWASVGPDPASITGWTYLAGGQESGHGSVRIYTKIADGTESGTLAVTHTLTQNTRAAQMTAFYNLAPTDIVTDATPPADIYEHSATDGQTPLENAGITTQTDNALVIVGYTHRGTQFGSVTNPSGYTDIGEEFDTDGADLNWGWAYDVKTTAGATGALDFTTTTGSSESYGTWVLAFKPKRKNADAA